MGLCVSQVFIWAWAFHSCSCGLVRFIGVHVSLWVSQVSTWAYAFHRCSSGLVSFHRYSSGLVRFTGVHVGLCVSQVFLLAIFLSLIIKNPGEDDEEEEELDEERTKLANDEIPLHDMNPESEETFSCLCAHCAASLSFFPCLFCLFVWCGVWMFGVFCCVLLLYVWCVCVRACVRACVRKLCKLLVCFLRNFCIFNNCSLSFKIYSMCYCVP